ncbi:MAG TPA: MarR family transcriptional regulator [Candidatus Dormibacteraeota bacterium]|nr:MarR family transcriptional regulator [Candidatus Dormibacteraeota bacterium]
MEELVAEAAPGRRGIDAWLTLLRAHATLVRQLAVDLVEETGLTLGDYDVLSQLAFAGGALRMTELADRAFSSRSGMTRRVDRLVEQGLVSRTDADADGRGVVVTLTDNGVSRFKETAPIHIRRVAELFAAPLDDEELAVVERAMKKVTLNPTFG